MEQGRINTGVNTNSIHQQNQPPPPPRRRPETQTEAAANNHHQHQHQHHQPPPPQKCPRCDSSNTKFCYYNNYSLSQPRYFCKGCRRYWTHGGTLRNVPVGGGCRKSKRPKPPDIARTQSTPVNNNPPPSVGPGQAFRAPVMPPNSLYPGGAFLSSLATVQSGINPTGTVNLGGRYDANVALLQNLQSLRPQSEIFPSHQNFSIPTIRPPPLSSWTQSFIRGGPSSGFWSRDGVDGENVNQGAGSSSFNPNQWPDINNNNDHNNPGFDPSR